MTFQFNDNKFKSRKFILKQYRSHKNVNYLYIDPFFKIIIRTLQK